MGLLLLDPAIWLEIKNSFSYEETSAPCFSLGNEALRTNSLNEVYFSFFGNRISEVRRWMNQPAMVESFFQKERKIKLPALAMRLSLLKSDRKGSESYGLSLKGHLGIVLIYWACLFLIGALLLLTELRKQYRNVLLYIWRSVWLTSCRRTCVYLCDLIKYILCSKK